MKTVFLDTNIFDKLVSDAESVSLIKTLREAGSIRVITSRTVRDELVGSPGVGLLDDLSIEIVGNATPVAGIMCAGDFLGAADYFFYHKGESNKSNDALVAAAAEFHADWLVSEDRRLVHRHQGQAQACDAMDYVRFVNVIKSLPK